MVAAGLDRDEAADAGEEAGGDGRGGCRHDVTDLIRTDPVRPSVEGRSTSLDTTELANGLILVRIADHLGHLRHRGERLRIELGRAAGDDDPLVRRLAMRAADGLARLAHGFVGDGAAVDDDRVVAGRARASPRSRRS